MFVTRQIIHLSIGKHRQINDTPTNVLFKLHSRQQLDRKRSGRFPPRSIVMRTSHGDQMARGSGLGENAEGGTSGEGDGAGWDE